MNIREVLSRWYANHKRELPWRKTKDPYKIWLSEVILQQTRVNQGVDYYYHFIKQYPTVGDLAGASMDEVLKSWQGLGYYTRARNLHKAARIIYYERKGKFPDNYRELVRLPGIGPYTASAIASFCFGEPVAVVDGNVGRVLARVTGIATAVNSTQGKKQLAEAAGEFIDPDDPATHNQAMMEFGALQCIPQNPDCWICPIKEICHAWQQDQVNVLPVKAPRPDKRTRHFYYIVIQMQGAFFMHRRNGRDIWNSLYQFPLIESKKAMDMHQLTKTSEWQHLLAGTRPRVQSISCHYSHMLTHQKIQARFIGVGIEQTNEQLEQYYRQINRESLENLAIPRLIEKYLEQENSPKNG